MIIYHDLLIDICSGVYQSLSNFLITLLTRRQQRKYPVLNYNMNLEKSHLLRTTSASLQFPPALISIFTILTSPFSQAASKGNIPYYSWKVKQKLNKWQAYHICLIQICSRVNQYLNNSNLTLFTSCQQRNFPTANFRL